jgi:hypothetical protein
MCCYDATASSFVPTVWDEVFSHFHTVAIKVTVEFGIDRMACQKEFFVNNTFDVKENYEHALDFALRLSHVFFVSVCLDVPLAFFPECLYYYCQGHCHTFSEICTKFVALPLSDPSQNCFRRDIQLQIKGQKKSACVC